MRICVSLGDLTSEQCLELAARERFVELRLDSAERPARAGEIRPEHTEVIAMFSVPGVSNAERLEDLQEALEAGAAFVDIEVDAEAGYRDALFEAARSVGAKAIRPTTISTGRRPANGCCRGSTSVFGSGPI